MVAVFISCSKMDDGTSSQADLKSGVVYCNEGEFFGSFSGIPGAFISNGWVFIQNNDFNLHIYMKPVSGFQNIANNIDIGFYTEPLPAGMRPDPDALHYHYSTGAISPEVGFDLVLPTNDLFIENLGMSSSLECGVPLYIVIHYDGIDASGNPYETWTGELVEGNTGGVAWWYKFVTYVPDCCIECTDETAWSAGMRYVTKGNWATYTSYAGVAKSVILFAGQYMEAGMVYFTPAAGGVNIRIELNEGWSFSDEYEPVKIQGYNSAPRTSPSPGLFNTYKGTSLNVTVPAFNFYGVHLDLRHCEE